VVLNVEADTPAARAGIKRGDLILKVDDTEIEDASDLKNTIGALPPGKKVKLTVERNKKTKVVEVKLGHFPDSIMKTEGDKGIVKGLTLQNLTPQVRRQLGIPDDIEGVIVSEVKADSEAAKAGFMPGDIIIQIEDMMIKDVGDVEKAMKRYPGKKRIYINRRGMIRILVVD
jgi:serine protease Do